MCQASTCGQVLAPSLVDESWYQLTNVLISAFSTDLKRIQTPYTLFWDFGPDKPLHQVYNPLVRMHSSSLSPSSLLPVIWQSLTKAIPEDNRKFDCKINGKALGTALLHSLGGLGGGKHKHRVFPSLWQSLLDAASLLEENVLLLLPF